MRLRTLAGLGALLPALAITALLAPPASAQDDQVSQTEDAVAGYDLAVALDEQGTAHVTLDLEMDFGAEPNRGPFLTYVDREWFDDEHDRRYRVRDVHAESSTGAATDVRVGEHDDRVVIRVGDEDRNDLTGLHRYRLTFTVDGWVNTAEAFDLPQDELYLDVVSEWELPISDLQVTVTGPAPVDRVACFAGPALDDTPCTSAEVDGDAAIFVQDVVPSREGLTVAVAFPSGTFGGAPPILQERSSDPEPFSTDAVPLGAAAAVLLGGGGLLAWHVGLGGRDVRHRGMTPGLLPLGGGEGGGRRRRRTPVAMEVTPPPGLSPGHLGTLLDEQADRHDVTATIVDLAVRGYLRIVQTQRPNPEGKGGGWRLERLHDGEAGLLPYEALLLNELFTKGRQVKLSSLRTRFAASMSQVQNALYEDVTERGWFRANPADVRTQWYTRGTVVGVLGIISTIILAVQTDFAFVGVALLLLGIVTIVVARHAPARTAAGTAVLTRLEGFRHYLATTEAAQIRSEEDEDVFSRYLPFAIVFGLTERWATVFADLAAHGRSATERSWYVGPGGEPFLWAAEGSTFTHDLATFTSTAGATLSAPSPGTSGGSGFSDSSSGYSGGSSGGSDGSSGGGTGGGGGGSW